MNLCTTDAFLSFEYKNRKASHISFNILSWAELYGGEGGGGGRIILQFRKKTTAFNQQGVN